MTVTVEAAARFMETAEGRLASATAARLIRLSRTNPDKAAQELDMHRRELRDRNAIDLFDRVIGLVAATMQE